MRKFLSELYTGLTTTPTGKFSHTKFWSNIAYLTATYVIAVMTHNGNLTEEYFMIYLGVVASHASVSKWLGRQNSKGLKDE